MNVISSFHKFFATPLYFMMILPALLPARAQEAWIVSSWPHKYLVETSTGKRISIPASADIFDLDVDSGTICGFQGGPASRIWIADLGRGMMLAEQTFDKSDIPDHPKVVASSNRMCALTLARGTLGVLSENGSMERLALTNPGSEDFKWVDLTYEDWQKSWLAISTTGFAWVAPSLPLTSIQIKPRNGGSDFQLSEFACCARSSREGTRLYAVAKIVTQDDSMETGLIEIDSRSGETLRRLLPYYPGQQDNYRLARLRNGPGTTVINELTNIVISADGNRLYVNGYRMPDNGGEQESGTIIVDLKGIAPPTLFAGLRKGGRLDRNGRYFFTEGSSQSDSPEVAVWSVDNGQKVRTLGGSLAAVGHGKGESLPVWEASAPAQLKPLPLSAAERKSLDEISTLVVKMAAATSSLSEFQEQLSEVSIFLRQSDGKTSVLDGVRIASLNRAIFDPNGTDRLPPFTSSSSGASGWNKVKKECQAFSQKNATPPSNDIRRQAYCLLSALEN